MINEYENILRTIIINVIGETDDATFGVTQERLDIWKEKREIEKKKNENIQIENRLVYYSDFYDLKTIIDKNWEKFKPILANRKRFTVFYEEIEKYRNNIAHGREILSFQLKMIEGIVDDLRNQLTLYHSKNLGPDDFFMKILKATDSLGNIWEPSQIIPLVVTNTTLRVGDKIEFVIDAFDPKGRELEYSARFLNDSLITQKSNKLTVEITSKMISKNCGIKIFVTTINSEYENYGFVNFSYSVIP